MIVVAFTGHRPQKIGGYNRRHPLRMAVRAAMRAELVSIISSTDEEVVVISGGALGVDTDAASIAHFDLGLRFMVAAPCQKHWAKWPRASQEAYQVMCSHASPELAMTLNTTGLFRRDGVLYIHNGPYNYVCMQQRNEWMVDHSDVLVAVWDGTVGGTANCVTYAEGTDIKIRRINPTTLINKED